MRTNKNDLEWGLVHEIPEDATAGYGARAIQHYDKLDFVWDRMGAFADYVKIEAARLLRVPDGLSLRDAALAEPLAVALHSLTTSRIEPGQRALVTGAGPLGLLVIAALRARGLELDLPFQVIKKALEVHQGVQRRLEVKGEKNDVIVMDDYGHHPTEIKTTLSAIRKSWPGKRIIVVFQPHRYTRTQALFSDFTRSFYQSDALVILPIYSAGETRINGVDAQALYDAIMAHGHKNVTVADDPDAAVSCLKNLLTGGDILLTLGAGDVWKVGEKVLNQM